MVNERLARESLEETLGKRLVYDALCTDPESVAHTLCNAFRQQSVRLFDLLKIVTADC